MSAPDTNFDKQTKRHRWPLVGIAAVVAFGAVMFLAILGNAVDDDDIGASDGPTMMEPTEGRG